VSVVRERMAWQRGERRRLSGVSSFGMGGTNAHVLLEEAPAASSHPTGARPAWHLLCLSARSPASLIEQARRLREHLCQHPDLDLADVAYTTQIGRTHFAHRACLSATGTPCALELLDALVSGCPADGVVRGSVEGPPPPLGFLFQSLATAGPVIGSPVIGSPVIGRELYESCAVFRATIDECMRRVAAAMRTAQPLLPWPSNGLPALPSRLAAFCTAYALGETWRSFGLSPRAVSGEPGGEQVAACFAGAVSLESLIEWLAAEARGAPPVAALPGAGSCELVSPSAFDAGWHVVAIDVASLDPSPGAPVATELARLHVAGFDIDWAAVSRGAGHRRVALPSYPFERRPYWIDDALADGAVIDDGLADRAQADRAEADRAEAGALCAAGSRSERETDSPALDEGTVETVLVQQLQLVSQLLDEQLALIELTAERNRPDAQAAN